MATIGAGGDFDVEKLIDDSEFINSLLLVKLEHIVEYRLVRGVEKFLHHLELVRQIDFAIEGKKY